MDLSVRSRRSLEQVAVLALGLAVGLLLAWQFGGGSRFLEISLLVLPSMVVAGVSGWFAGRREELLTRRAQCDPLTLLHTMNWFQTRLVQECARARRQGRPISVLVVELDSLDEVNGEFGQPAGDNLLVALAEHLRMSIREEEVVARVGGRSFGVLLYDSTREQAEQARQRLQERLSMVRVLTAEGGMIGPRVRSVVAGSDEVECRGDLLWRLVRSRLRASTS